MTPEEKRRIIRQRLEEFLALPLEEKLAIDEDPRNDGLFNTLQEMNDIVESCMAEDSMTSVDTFSHPKSGDFCR